MYITEVREMSMNQTSYGVQEPQWGGLPGLGAKGGVFGDRRLQKHLWISIYRSKQQKHLMNLCDMDIYRDMHTRLWYKNIYIYKYIIYIYTLHCISYSYGSSGISTVFWHGISVQLWCLPRSRWQHWGRLLRSSTSWRRGGFTTGHRDEERETPWKRWTFSRLPRILEGLLRLIFWRF